jgi:DNA repair protein SbcC/Rad50
MKRTLTTVSVLAAALALSAVALAEDDPRPSGPGAVKAAEKRAEAAAKREAAAEKRDDKREAAAEKREDKREAAAEKREDRKADHADVIAAWKKLKETRRERRKERIDEIKKQWGNDFAGRPAVKAELKVHAWRVARLNRMRAIAKAESKDAVVTRIDGLLEKERARHKKHMETLKTTEVGK